MSHLVPALKRSFDRWSSAETCELIKAWAPLYRRRRRATKDVCRVPLHTRGRARSCRALVAEDWRAVALAVNSYRATTARRDSCRTYLQCKKRMQHLKMQYAKGLAPRLGWPFYSLLHAALADQVGDHSAGAVQGGGAQCPAVADERGIAMVFDARASAAAVEAFVPAAAGDASRGSAIKVPDGAEAGGTAAKDCHAVAVAMNSCRTSDGISIERTHKQCRARVKLVSDVYSDKKHDPVLDAAVGEERGGMEDASCVDGRGAAAAAAAAEAARHPAASVPRSAAAVSSDAEVIIKLAEEVTKLAKEVTKLGGMYRDMRMKALDVDREKATAGHAGVDRRA